MKKLLLICLMFAGIVSANAQLSKPMVNPNGFALDTASQAAAEGPKITVTGNAKTISIVLVTLKISGTIAGTIAWQGSNDGVNFASIGSATTLVDASTNYTYKEVDKGYAYYKALITQTSTSSLSYKGTSYTSQQ